MDTRSQAEASRIDTCFNPAMQVTWLFRGGARRRERSLIRTLFVAAALCVLIGDAASAQTTEITIGYLRYARKRIDPQVRAVRKGAGR